MLSRNLVLAAALCLLCPWPQPAVGLWDNNVGARLRVEGEHVARRAHPSINLDFWVYSAERVNEQLFSERNMVVLVRDTPGFSDAAVDNATAAAALSSTGVALAYTTDTVNNFVRVTRYFHLPDPVPGRTRHYVIGAVEGRAGPGDEMPVQEGPDGVRFKELPWWSVELPAVADASVIRGVLDAVKLRAPPPDRLVIPSMSPCPQGFSLYIYPDSGDSPMLGEHYVQWKRVLAQMAYVTTDPRQACLFLPPTDTTPVPPYLRGGMGDFGDGRALTDILRRLPFWNGGRNHVVFDWTDSRARFYHADSAIVLKTGYDVAQYRAGHDVAALLPPSKPVQRDKVTDLSNRPVLVSFMGALWKGHLGQPEETDVRRRLLPLHNGRDVIILDRTSQEAQAVDYTELMLKSRFGVVARGGGLHSYRFAETLSAGTIPVILSDDWVIPFREIVRPEAYSIRIREADAHTLLDVLRAIPPQKVQQLHRNVRTAYESCFSTPLQTAMHVLRLRVESKLQRAQEAEVEAAQAASGAAA